MRQDDKALLQRLQKHQVEFVVIGGVCGIIHGVTLVTTDLDVCCRFVPRNLYRHEEHIPRGAIARLKLAKASANSA